MAKRAEDKGHHLRGLPRVIYKSLILGSLIGLAVLPPIANRDVVEANREWHINNKADCAQGVEPSNTEGYPFDVIAVPGGGMTIDKNGNMIPGKLETRRLYAAAILWLTHQAPHIVLLDGYQGLEADPNIDKVRLQEIVRQLSGYTVEIPWSAIEVETESLNTTENAREMKKIAEKNNWKKIAVDTDNFHIMRAVMNFCINNMNSTGFPVEEVISEWAPFLEEQINHPNDLSFGSAGRQLKEIYGMLDLIYTRGEGSVWRKHLIKDDRSDDTPPPQIPITGTIYFDFRTIKK